jgi:hypothetical protein
VEQWENALFLFCKLPASKFLPAGYPLIKKKLAAWTGQRSDNENARRAEAEEAINQCTGERPGSLTAGPVIVCNIIYIIPLLI